MIYNTWNSSIRNKSRLDRTTHRYLIEPVSRTPHIKILFVTRFMNFINKLMCSRKTAAKNLFKNRHDCRVQQGVIIRHDCRVQQGVIIRHDCRVQQGVIIRHDCRVQQGVIIRHDCRVQQGVIIRHDCRVQQGVIIRHDCRSTTGRNHKARL